MREKDTNIVYKSKEGTESVVDLPWHVCIIIMELRPLVSLRGTLRKVIGSQFLVHMKNRKKVFDIHM